MINFDPDSLLGRCCDADRRTTEPAVELAALMVDPTSQRIWLSRAVLTHTFRERDHAVMARREREPDLHLLIDEREA